MADPGADRGHSSFCAGSIVPDRGRLVRPEPLSAGLDRSELSLAPASAQARDIGCLVAFDVRIADRDFGVQIQDHLDDGDVSRRPGDRSGQRLVPAVPAPGNDRRPAALGSGQDHGRQDAGGDAQQGLLLRPRVRLLLGLGDDRGLRPLRQAPCRSHGRQLARRRP